MCLGVSAYALLILIRGYGGTSAALREHFESLQQAFRRMDADRDGRLSQVYPPTLVLCDVRVLDADRDGRLSQVYPPTLVLWSLCSVLSLSADKPVGYLYSMLGLLTLGVVVLRFGSCGTEFGHCGGVQEGSRAAAETPADPPASQGRYSATHVLRKSMLYGVEAALGNDQYCRLSSRQHSLRAPYAMPGTEVAYGATSELQAPETASYTTRYCYDTLTTRCLVLTYAMNWY
eukprot:3193366-Rhodomonas_salina.3